MDDLPSGAGTFIDHPVPQLQDVDGIVEELQALGGDFDILGGPHDEPGTQLLLQRPDVGGDGGLGDVQALSSLGEAIEPHHGRKGFQLFKFHGRFPPERAGRRPHGPRY